MPCGDRLKLLNQIIDHELGHIAGGLGVGVALGAGEVGIKVKGGFAIALGAGNGFSGVALFEGRFAFDAQAVLLGGGPAVAGVLIGDRSEPEASKGGFDDGVGGLGRVDQFQPSVKLNALAQGFGDLQFNGGFAGFVDDGRDVDGVDVGKAGAAELIAHAAGQ